MYTKHYLKYLSRQIILLRNFLMANGPLEVVGLVTYGTIIPKLRSLSCLVVILNFKRRVNLVLTFRV